MKKSSLIKIPVLVSLLFLIAVPGLAQGGIAVEVFDSDLGQRIELLLPATDAPISLGGSLSLRSAERLLSRGQGECPVSHISPASWRMPAESEILPVSLQLTRSHNTFETLLRQAERGDLDSQYRLAWVYLTGEGLPGGADARLAARWFGLAANRGMMEACHQLAVLYLQGRGLIKSEQRAFELFKLASDQGHAESQYQLGLMYDQGLSVQADAVKAATYFEKAGEQGNCEAQYSLGLMYGQGRGVEQDHDEAARWLKMAADQGLAQAQLELGGYYYQGLGVRRDYTEAARLLNEAAAKGLSSAQIFLDQIQNEGLVR